VNKKYFDPNILNISNKIPKNKNSINQKAKTTKTNNFKNNKI